MSFVLIPKSLLLFCFPLAVPYVGLLLSPRKLSQIATMTEDVQNKLSLMSLESDYYKILIIYHAILSLFNNFSMWRVHDKLLSKCIPKNLINCVRVIFWSSRYESNCSQWKVNCKCFILIQYKLFFFKPFRNELKIYI